LPGLLKIICLSDDLSRLMFFGIHQAF